MAILNHITFDNGFVNWKQIERRNGMTFMRIVKRKQDLAEDASEIFSVEA